MAIDVVPYRVGATRVKHAAHQRFAVRGRMVLADGPAPRPVLRVERALRREYGLAGERHLWAEGIQRVAVLILHPEPWNERHLVVGQLPTERSELLEAITLDPSEVLQEHDEGVAGLERGLTVLHGIAAATGERALRTNQPFELRQWSPERQARLLDPLHWRRRRAGHALGHGREAAKVAGRQ